MQTFLTHKSFKQSACTLDDKRCCKQITEAFQILDLLKMYKSNGTLKPKYEQQFKGKVPSWIHHPANIMWIGYENTLCYYISCFLYEWTNVRGKNYARPSPEYTTPIEYPPWFCRTLRKSHRSQLFLKRPDLYPRFEKNSGWCYYWPFTWSNDFGRRIQVPPKIYKIIGRLPKKDFDKEINKIKKYGIKAIIGKAQ